MVDAAAALGAAAGFGAAADPASMLPSTSPGGNFRAFLRAQWPQHARGWRVHFHRDLVGFSSTSGSSAATTSPGFFIQRAIVALLTLSPSGGTVIWVDMVDPSLGEG